MNGEVMAEVDLGTSSDELLTTDPAGTEVSSSLTR